MLSIREGVFHRCRCTGQEFTFVEWQEYLRLHPNSGREAVYSYNGYDFNINDVCINPSRERFELSNGSYVELSYCIFDSDLWICGYDYYLNIPNNMCWSCVPPLYWYENSYSNCLDAKLASLRSIYIHIKSSNACKSIKRIALELKQIIYDLEHKQLTLF